MNPALIIGFGYIGAHLARAELARRGQVVALVRSPERAAVAHSLGAETLNANLDEPATLRRINAKSSRLFYLAPPPQTGNTDPRIDHLLAALTKQRAPDVFVYVSTTAVYGDCKDTWVDEQTPPHPTQDRGVRRLAAEQSLLKWSDQTGTRVVILRVGGIYGPDRIPLARLRANEPMVDDPLHPSFVNVIHADDLVATLQAAAEHGVSKQVYVVCDGHSTTMMRYFQVIARAANLPIPPGITMQQARELLTPGMLSYVAESRRLQNKKMLEDLHVKLRFPNISLGIADCLERSGETKRIDCTLPKSKTGE